MATSDHHAIAAMSLPDPVAFLRDRGIELPKGAHLLATHTIDNVEVARMGTECISLGKFCGCFCKKTCDTARVQGGCRNTLS